MEFGLEERLDLLPDYAARALHTTQSSISHVSWRLFKAPLATCLGDFCSVSKSVLFDCMMRSCHLLADALRAHVLGRLCRGSWTVLRDVQHAAEVGHHLAVPCAEEQATPGEELRPVRALHTRQDNRNGPKLRGQGTIGDWIVPETRGGER